MTQQAMLTRTFLPLRNIPRDVGGEHAYSYLVHYPGQAEDFNAWLGYYVHHHPQIMLDYPGVTQVQVFTRLDWCDAMPFERVAYMQRNQLTFPSIKRSAMVGFSNSGTNRFGAVPGLCGVFTVCAVFTT